MMPICSTLLNRTRLFAPLVTLTVLTACYPGESSNPLDSIQNSRVDNRLTGQWCGVETDEIAMADVGIMFVVQNLAPSFDAVFTEITLDEWYAARGYPTSVVGTDFLNMVYQVSGNNLEGPNVTFSETDGVYYDYDTANRGTGGKNYVLLRYVLSGDRLNVYAFDDEMIAEAIDRGLLSGTFDRDDEGLVSSVVVTSSTSEWQNYLSNNNPMQVFTSLLMSVERCE